MTIAERNQLVSDPNLFKILRYCVLVDELVVSIDHFSISVNLLEKVKLLQLLEEFDEVSEVWQIIPSLYLQRCRSADLEDEVCILKANTLLFFSRRQFCKVLPV